MAVELKPETAHLVQEEIQKGSMRPVDESIVLGALRAEEAAEVPIEEQLAAGRELMKHHRDTFKVLAK